MTSHVAALILNWNNESDTAACLNSLLTQHSVSLDIALIDNASSDGSGDRLHAQFPTIPYLQSGANLGYAGGNNVGIAWALERGAEWILVINNDTVAEPDCVSIMLAAARADPALAAVAPLIVRFDDPSRVWFAGGRFSEFRAVGVHEGENLPTPELFRLLGSAVALTASRECSFLTGCCLLLRADAIRAVGAFRADYFAYVEDVELSLRLRRAGWRLGWVPAARLAHRVPAHGTPPSAWQIRLRDRNRRRLVRDAYSLPRRVAFLLWFWPTRLIHLARYALARDWARTNAIVAGMSEP